ncbi:OmpG family monomeric porin [Salmonella enterica]|uniref:OmpG family monomeric porin n=1 Tax=Salmonella enterica TaxID=28901 RepID=A0A403SZE5_SALER|nr:OmpG family monomeric porin [Salmonella enterica]MMS76866.1 OmpG family monomeric porin [Salmonella enterica]
MNRNTLLCALPLLASGIGLPVMAADIDTDDIQQKVDTGLDQTPASKPWKVRAGLLIETENKEGQSFDKDGFFEPTLWMDFSRDRWTFYGSYYQETHGTNYSDGFSRDNWFNQYEFDARYIPITFSLFDAGPTTITPYGRWTLDVWSQNASRNQRMHTTETRTGIFIEQMLSPHLSMTLDYAYEVQARHDLSPGDKPIVKFHKTGLGFIYSF